jgi:uncharacterized membrane protein
VHGVALLDDASLSGPAGGQVIYTLTISNTGNVVDIFDLQVIGNVWMTTLSSQVVTLGAGGSQEVAVTVLIPPGAVDQDTDTVNITATSQGDSSKTDSAVLTTTSVSTPVFGIALSGDNSLSGPVGGQVIYTLTISNTGNVVDTFNLLATGNSWTTTLSYQVVTLAAGDSQVVNVKVLIPASAGDQETDTVNITATSQSDISKSDSATFATTSVSVPSYGVVLSPDDSLSGLAGGQVTYTLTIGNTGNVVDTFDLLPSGNIWTTTLSSQVVTLAAGGSQVMNVTVLIPASATVFESDQISIQATSRHDNRKNDNVVLTTVAIDQNAELYLPIVMLKSP